MKHLTRLADCLAWLEQLHPVDIELGLTRVQAVATKLGVKSLSAKVVTIAGTNGKGSATAMLEAGLLQLSQRVGCYTSPHLFQFNERIRIDGEAVSDELIVAALHRIEAARGAISLTYFEYTTLAALLIFEAAQLDVVVLEVGLGGRLDAVNIIDADIAVVTSIALDHQDWLGNTRDAIAIEKLGIARPNKPVLITEWEPPLTMAQSVAATGAKPYWVGQEMTISSTADTCCVSLANGASLATPKPVSLSLESWLTALQVLQWLGHDLKRLDLNALAATSVAGRFQQLPCVEGAAVVLDVAHNPAAIQRLVDKLHAQYPRYEFVVCYATMADKDVDAVLEILDTLPVSHWYLPTIAIPRALKTSILAQKIADVVGSTEIQCIDTIAPLFGQLRNNQCLLICGSFYTVAAAYEAYQNTAV